VKQFIWGAAFGVSCTLALGAMAAITPEAGKALDRFAEALERTQANYVEPVGISDLVDKAIAGMLSSMDPHSSYYTAKSYADAISKTPNAAVGMELTLENGFVRVVAPLDDSPAAAAGIKPGDILLAIDNQSMEHRPLDEIIDSLRGAEQSQVTLTVRHAPGELPQTVILTRAFVRQNKVKSERKGDVGYIRINGFNEGTADGLHEALRNLRQQIGPKFRGYIIDLRNSPGGLLDQAIAVSDEFLASGNIVSMHGRHAEDNQKYDAKGGGLFESGDTADSRPVIVLVNQGTAAGAEIVAAALQDNKRATIIGMKTFGSGTVQTIIPLGSGAGALRLTTSKFYRPSGAAIQVAGITPDIAVAQSATDGSESNWSKPSEVQLRGHFPGDVPQAGPAIIRPDPTKHEDDFQLSYALERMAALPTAAKR
jgi:carboxyl-terminal processing protease